MPAAGKTLALFDFDGTITHKDTLFEAIKFICGKRRFYLGIMLLAPQLFLYLIHIIPNWKIKELVLSRFWGGMPAALFDTRCEQFTKTVLPSLIREKAMAAIGDLKKQKAEIIVVTASAENWVAPWCRQLELGCIATCLEVKNKLLTGKIKGLNCNGIEKVNRIREAIDLSKYDEITAFGDSKGDLPMLDLATNAYYKAFHD